jgi:hypothetical protein
LPQWRVAKAIVSFKPANCRGRLEYAPDANPETKKTQAEEISDDGLDLYRHEQGRGDPEHLKAFADEAAVDEWFKDNDPKGVALNIMFRDSRPAGSRA